MIDSPTQYPLLVKGYSPFSPSLIGKVILSLLIDRFTGGALPPFWAVLSKVISPLLDHLLAAAAKAERANFRVSFILCL
jgi:hypothetical protein